MRFELRTRLLPDSGDLPEGFDPVGPRNLGRIRESVIGELADLLAASGLVANRTRLFNDLFNREKKAPTALGEGIALPHVRTLQAKEFVMAFARSGEGLPFHAPDEQPVHLFFAMVAPPYDDRTYLKVLRTLGQALLQPEHLHTFRTAQAANDIWAVLEQFR